MSFQEIARKIDRIYPPQSMGELASRFRYPGVQPGEPLSGVVSLRALEARVSGDQARQLEFLHYNTWLIKGNFLLADVIKGLGGWNRFVECMGLFPLDILVGVLKRISTSKICDQLFDPYLSICGVSINPANSGCKAVGYVADLAALLIKTYGKALDFIFDLLEAPFNVIVDVVCGILGYIPLEWSLKEAICIDDRALEIGNEVFKYDFVSLCEVWRQEHKDVVLGRGPAVPVLTGPGEPAPGEWKHSGSGLLVFSPTYPISDGGNHLYETAGVVRKMQGGCDFGRMVDADLWARKGIQRTLVDVGYGFIEVYSTHLYSGGDMLGATASLVFGGEPDKPEKAEKRAAQIQELAQFIADTHEAGNVAIIAGDFNVQKEERDGLYTEGPIFTPLLDPNAPVRFNDWYLLSAFIMRDDAGVSIDPDRKAGNTCRWGSTDNWEFPFFEPVVNPTGPNNFLDYCSEISLTEPKSVADGRIDYIFVQNPEVEHAFNLDVSRIRRRAFMRPCQDCSDGLQFYMSDHMGLEVTLFVSPK